MTIWSSTSTSGGGGRCEPTSGSRSSPARRTSSRSLARSSRSRHSRATGLWRTCRTPLGAGNERPAKDGTPLVGARDQAQQCAGSRPEGLYLERSASHRALAETLSRTEPAPQERAVSLGDVDADLLRQPRREKPELDAAARSRASQYRAPKGLPQRVRRSRSEER